jgi:hypothetical protein
VNPSDVSSTWSAAGCAYVYLIFLSSIAHLLIGLMPWFADKWCWLDFTRTKDDGWKTNCLDSPQTKEERGTMWQTYATLPQASLGRTVAAR